MTTQELELLMIYIEKLKEVNHKLKQLESLALKYSKGCKLILDFNTDEEVNFEVTTEENLLTYLKTDTAGKGSQWAADLYYEDQLIDTEILNLIGVLIKVKRRHREWLITKINK